jgi:hypothetical protein
MELKESIDTLSLNEVLGAVIEVDGYLGEVGKVTVDGRQILHYRAELQDRLETEPASNWADLFARLRWIRHEMAVGGDPERVRCAVARIEADLAQFARREGVTDLAESLGEPCDGASLAPGAAADDASDDADVVAREAESEGDTESAAAQRAPDFERLLLRRAGGSERVRATPSV